MTARAEWDPQARKIIQIEDDNPPPGHPPVSYTGVIATPGVTTEWHELVFDYPSSFHPAFPQLLGPWNAELSDEDDKIHALYPYADFSPQSIRDEITRQINARTNRALIPTDWYFIRKIESNKPVPKDVTDERDKIRAFADDLITRLAGVDDDIVGDFIGDVPLDMRMSALGSDNARSGIDTGAVGAMPDLGGITISEPPPVAPEGTEVAGGGTETKGNPKA